MPPTPGRHPPGAAVHSVVLALLAALGAPAQTQVVPLQLGCIVDFEGVRLSTKVREAIALAFDFTEYVLENGGQHLPRWQRSLANAITGVESWLFEGMRHQRFNIDVDVLWASLQVSSTLCWMRRLLRCKQVRMIAMLLAPAHRGAIVNPQQLLDEGGQSLLKMAIRSLMLLQRAAITFRSQSESIVYA